MPAPPYPHAMAPAALKWRDLAERRRAHFVELHQSGRWKHYYTEDRFAFEMRQAVALAERWAKIAPRPEMPRRKAG